MLRKKLPKTDLSLLSSGLIQEFSSALRNASVAESLEFQADHSEALALQHIASAGASNSVYVTPQDIPQAQLASIAKESLNAHMQKTQAKQVSAYTGHELGLAEKRVTETYIGMRVTVRVLSTKPWPIDTCWRDKHGRYHINQHGPRKVSGYIEQINLRQDFIIIRPTRLFKVINNSIEFHRIYIITPDTLEALVGLEFA